MCPFQNPLVAPMKAVGSFHCPVITGWIHNGSRPWYIHFLLMGLVLLLFSPCPLFAEQSTPSGQTVSIHPGLQSAREAAAEDHSLILMILTTHQCRNCDRLALETLTSPGFIDQVGILHLVTININEQQRYASDYQVRKVPDLILLTPEGEIVQRLILKKNGSPTTTKPCPTPNAIRLSSLGCSAQPNPCSGLEQLKSSPNPDGKPR